MTVLNIKGLVKILSVYAGVIGCTSNDADDLLPAFEGLSLGGGDAKPSAKRQRPTENDTADGTKRLKIKELGGSKIKELGGSKIKEEDRLKRSKDVELKHVLPGSSSNPKVAGVSDETKAILKKHIKARQQKNAAKTEEPVVAQPEARPIIKAKRRLPGRGNDGETTTLSKRRSSDEGTVNSSPVGSGRKKRTLSGGNKL